ncbi:MAG TPA: hypothetical protein VF516_03705 [Kofleriaceae bacterium]
MSTLSTAAWAAHDVGLATAIGGTLYGRAALEPALREIADPAERDRVATSAWQRFTWLNLAAHGVFAATWFIGRSMLSGREVSCTARRMTQVKDGLVIASLVTGIGTAVLGRMLGKCARRGEGPAQVREAGGTARGGERTVALQRAVGGLGIANLVANIATLGITAALAMEGSRSPRFSARSRFLP